MQNCQSQEFNTLKNIMKGMKQQTLPSMDYGIQIKA